MSKQAAGTRIVHAVCSHDCPDSCGVLVTVQAGTDGQPDRAVKVQGDTSHPVTRGFLCGKVAKYLDRVYSPDRLLYPMRRRPGVPKGPLAQGREADAFERISWDEALDEIAAKLHKVAAEFGPESVLPYSYAGTIGQLGYGSMDRRFFHRLGASQLDRTICSSAGGQALKSVYGIKLGTRPEDFAHAGLILAWGANIHGNNVHLWPFIEEARRNGARLIVIDPYRTRTAALADEHLAINPGTDTALALGLMHVILSMGLEDRDYIASCTHGFAELRAHALRPGHAPRQVAKATGIAAETIIRLAQDYAGAMKETGRPAAIRLNYGIQRSENGGTAARAVAMLPLLTGAWKYKGGGLQLSTSGSFPFDSDALQMPELMLRSPLKRHARVVNMSELGSALTSLQSPPVKAFFVYNSNPAAVAPNQNDVLSGMRRKDLFTVVHEQFFTDTADYADILLPAATFLETRDVQGAYGHLFVQLSQRAIEPLGEARNNVVLFGELARRMGFEEACFDDREDDLIDQALRSESPWFAGITPSAARARRSHRPQPAAERSRRGSAVQHRRMVQDPQRARRAGPCAGIRPTGRVPWRRRRSQRRLSLEFLPRKADNYMNSTFANLPGAPAHGVANRRRARDAHPRRSRPRHLLRRPRRGLQRPRERSTFVRWVNAQVGTGVVAARLDWNKMGRDLSGGGANVNALTSERLTDIGGGATFYSTLVEVRKTGSSV